MNKEKVGVLFTIVSAMLWGVFPILVNAWSAHITPLFFAAILSLFTALGTALWMIIRKKTSELRIKKAYFPLFMVSICIVFIPSVLFFIGTSKTSGINSSVLMLSEIIFTLIFTPFFGEKNTTEKYIGALGIMIGGALVLYKGEPILFNTGDILILLSTITFPIGNFYSKRALYSVSPSVVITVRYALGGILLLITALCVEPSFQLVQNFTSYVGFFFVMGFVLLSACKITFYEGMKRLDISKVISLEMTYPLFSLLVLYFAYNTPIMAHQLFGIGIMIFGGYYAVKRKSEQHDNLKYQR